MLLSRYPIVWLTVGAFALLACYSRNGFNGGILLAVGLPVTLFLQLGIRKLSLRFHVSTWLRRILMLIAAFAVAFSPIGMSLIFPDRAAVKIALAGQLPSGIKDLQVSEDAWTDYVVRAYFRCDPASLKAILERPPFARSDRPTAFSIHKELFPELRTLPDTQSAIIFYRTDLGEAPGFGRVFTNSSFSFAYIEYGVD